MKITYLKGILFLTLCMAILAGPCLCSCSDDAHEDIDNSKPNTYTSVRSVEEAINIANRAAGMTASQDTRSASRTVDTQNDVVIISSKSTRSAGGTDTLLYVVNYSDGQGFAVISAQRSTEGLLAVTENGTFTSSTLEEEENEGFKDFMQQAEAYVASQAAASTAEANAINTVFVRKPIVDTLYILRITPRVEVQWGQTSYEGAYCPNNIAGCSNVAMAQIMSYFQYPLSLTLDYDSTEVTSITLDWDALKKHKTSHSYEPCTASLQTHTVLGKVIRQLGKMNCSTYEATGTFTYADSVRKSFSQLGYQVSSLLDYQGEDFCDQFLSNKLIYMRGTCDEGGHGWVVDGNLKVKIIENGVLYKDSDSESTSSDSTRIVSYIHINWGWYGASNGYFYTEVLSTQKAHSYDNDRRTESNYDFDSFLRYFEISI